MLLFSEFPSFFIHLSNFFLK